MTRDHKEDEDFEVFNGVEGVEGRKYLEKLRGGPLTFAILFKSIRECEDWTQAEYGEMLGLSRQKVCDYEKGRRSPSAAKAAEFARILGYDAESFARMIFEEQIAKAGLKLKVVSTV